MEADQPPKPLSDRNVECGVWRWMYGYTISGGYCLHHSEYLYPKDPNLASDFCIYTPKDPNLASGFS